MAEDTMGQEWREPTHTNKKGITKPLTTSIDSSLFCRVYTVWLCQEKESDEITGDNTGNTFSEHG